MLYTCFPRFNSQYIHEGIASPMVITCTLSYIMTIIALYLKMCFFVMILFYFSWQLHDSMFVVGTWELFLNAPSMSALHHCNVWRSRLFLPISLRCVRGANHYSRQVEVYLCILLYTVCTHNNSPFTSKHKSPSLDYKEMLQLNRIVHSNIPLKKIITFTAAELSSHYY